MDVLRRDTDYALRMMVNLAGHFNGKFTSARRLADDGNFSYQLGCKILQKLHQAKLVKSDRGPKGGFALSRPPAKINLMEIIIAKGRFGAIGVVDMTYVSSWGLLKDYEKPKIDFGI